jgi:gluconokinase
VAERAEDVVIGVDIGTTSAKAVAFTAGGEARASAHRTHDAGVEADAGVVADATVAAAREAAAEAGEAGHRVAALAFSSAMHSLIALDGRGAPITPMLTWADARAAGQADRLRAEGGALALQQRTGTPVHPMSPLVKLRWFAEEEPDTAAAAAHWAGIKEYVLQRLTGELVVDHGMASGTGLWDLAGEDWDAEALDYAGVTPEQLPRPLPTTEALRPSADGARELGVPQDTPLVLGAGDGPLANLGLGAIRPGAVACSIGTSGAVRVVADTPRVDERGSVFCYVLAPGRYVTGGAVNNGGIVLDWLGDAIAPGLEPDALLEAAGRVPAGSDGVLFLPQLLGERAPRWAGDPRGAYLGLTTEHRREQLLRAGIEGVCLQLAVVLASLEQAGVEISEVRATGGFSRSPLWRGILAAAFGRPVGFAASPEGSALGAALLGMTAIGMLDSLDRAAELVAVTSTERPDPADAQVYARLLPVFEAAYDALLNVTGLAGR